MRKPILALALVLSLASAAGCFAPSVSDCQFACAVSADCPNGLDCVAGACRAPGATGECPAIGADAEPDAPPPMLDLGDGADGALVVTGRLVVDTGSAALAVDAAAGAQTITLATDAGFAAGDEVLVIQMTGPAAGRHETARVASVDPSAEPPQLVLDAPLAHAYAATATGDRAQVVRVGNFTSVTVTGVGQLLASAWDDATGTGGVLFFRAQAGVQIDAGGQISVEARGFGGGGGGATALGGAGGGGGDGGNGVGGLGGGTSCTTAQTPPEPGGPGQIRPPNGGAGAGGGGAFGCDGAAGGVGGGIGEAGGPVSPGNPGGGPGGGAGAGAGGDSATASFAQLTPGGGGAGGDGGGGGAGGGGGGGGGGAQNPCVNGSNGQNGMTGGAGGAGGAGGVGGSGGGLLVIHADSIVVAGSIAAGGAAGIGGGPGAGGAAGGAGGNGGTRCGNPLAGAGGGGNGAAGGGAGHGGGGGAGGTVVLLARTLALGTNLVTARGGIGGGAGSPGTGGPGGMPGTTSGNAASPGGPGAAGAEGTAGGAGAPGKILVGCPGGTCSAQTDPAGIVIPL